MALEAQLVALAQALGRDIKALEQLSGGSQTRGMVATIQDRPVVGETILFGIAPYSFTPDSSASTAKAMIAANGNAVADIFAGPTKIGTLSFFSGQTVGVFAFTAGIAEGDLASIVWTSVDAALANIAILLRPAPADGGDPGGGSLPGGI